MSIKLKMRNNKRKSKGFSLIFSFDEKERRKQLGLDWLNNFDSRTITTLIRKRGHNTNKEKTPAISKTNKEEI
jgi:hypothetical protein